MYANVLNRVRVGALNKGDIKTLSSRLIHPLTINPVNVLHLFPTNKQAKSHNKKIQKLINEPTFSVKAYHYFSQSDFGSKDGNVTDDLIPEDDRDAGGLPQILTFSKQTRIMLIRNIFTKEGLVNGAMGYVQNVSFNDQTGEPCCIYVNFDDKDIGKILQDQSKNSSILIEPICQEYHYKGRSIIREQFPLTPSWARTIHKVQGASLDQAVVSIGNDVFERSTSYVALSRLRTLDGLFLTAINPDKVKPFLDLVEEYARLRSIAEGFKK